MTARKDGCTKAPPHPARDQARIEYEQTGAPSAEIAARAGVSAVTLRKWAQLGHWRRPDGVVAAMRRAVRLRVLAEIAERRQAGRTAAMDAERAQSARLLVPSVWALGTGERVTGRHGALSAVVMPVE